MKIFDKKDILAFIDMKTDLEALIQSQKAAFKHFSEGLYDVPMPMQFIFKEYGSDCHIKAGFKQGSPYLVVKLASSGLEGNNGTLLVFKADNGKLIAILQDEGYLTTLRTAITGIIALEQIPWDTQNIGIVGSGSLAKTLHSLLSVKHPNKNTLVYARNRNKALSITDNICDSINKLINQCDLIFTATSAENPIIHDFRTQGNQAIIALGSDDLHKKELSLEMYAKSELVIVDSKHQALQLGDVSKALASNRIAADALVELGKILSSKIPISAKTIIADFSGIGAQDVAITEFVLSKLQPLDLS
jgi:ornithine cyclodeaminase